MILNEYDLLVTSSSLSWSPCNIFVDISELPDVINLLKKNGNTDDEVISWISNLIVFHPKLDFRYTYREFNRNFYFRVDNTSNVGRIFPPYIVTRYAKSILDGEPYSYENVVKTLDQVYRKGKVFVFDGGFSYVVSDDDRCMVLI